MSGDPMAQGLHPADELRLPPEARSVRTARRHLRELLRDARHEAWADAAELALSEIVTNAVLHAHTELRVRIAIGASEVRVEVEDTNPTLPSQRRGHDAQATTGRGLELVTAVTRDCGVHGSAAGKVVWFTVGDALGDELSEEELLAAWATDTEWGAPAGTPGAAHEELQRVVLPALPTTLWFAAREHHHAMLRELVLYLAEHPEHHSVPDLALADEARHLVWNTLLDEVERARGEGRAASPLPPGHPSVLPDVPRSIDLEVLLPRRLSAGFGAFQDALDLAERLSVADKLLVRPGLPEVVAVRDWLCEQVVAQLAGVPPSPWPGTDQSRFADLVHDREEPALPEWDATEVTRSDRGVIAADDANRIIAISPSLADALGWDPQDLVGRRVVAVIPPSLREAHVAGFSRHLTTGESSVLGVPLELPVLRRDNSEIPCTFLVERADTTGGRPVYLAWIEPLSS